MENILIFVTILDISMMFNKTISILKLFIVFR